MPSLTSNFYQFGEFRLDAQNRLLRRGDELVALTPKAFDLLLLLIQHSGEVVTKDELMHAVWADSFVEESNLTQTVFMLRKALGETPEQRYIRTVQGSGYRFVPEVKAIAGNGDAGAVAAVSSENVAASADAIRAQPGRTWWAAPRLADYRGWLLISSAAIFVLIAGTIGYLRWSGSQRQAAEPDQRLLIAVLPLQNLTGDSAQEYLSDGLTEELIAQLGNLDPQRLGVIARTSVMHYKNSQTSLEQIGRELGVQYLIEGSVRSDGKNVRVTAQLIQIKDQTHVWARQYDRELIGLLSLQGEIAREIADEIQLPLGFRKPALPVKPAVPPQSYEAYDLYLKGQYFFNKRTAADIEEAIGYFQRAIAISPNSARAYAGLADSYALLGAYSAQSQPEFMSKARAAAVRALQLDDGLPEAHTALALIVQNHDWDWKTAEKEFRRAIELNPNYATAHHWYAEHLMWRGRFNEALEESEKARQLDPLSLIIAADNGAILYFSRHYDRAIQKWQSVREMEPNFLRARLIAGAYVEKGMFAEAMADNERLRSKISSASYWSWRAYIQGRAGQTAEARYALRTLLQMDQDARLDPMIIAQAYAGLGDKGQALAWLGKAFEQHSNELTSLKVNPTYDALHADPRFQDLLRRVGLLD